MKPEVQAQVPLLQAPLPLHSGEPGHLGTPIEQSSPDMPSSHVHFPSTHSPRPLQSIGHCLKEQSSPAHRGWQKQVPGSDTEEYREVGRGRQRVAVEAITSKTPVEEEGPTRHLQPDCPGTSRTVETLAVATAVVLALAAGSRSADDGKEHEERLVHRVDSAA